MAFSYAINGVSDLDQRWNSLPGNGANHCVPTSVMNFMYYYRGKGFGNAVKYDPSQYSDHRPRNIRALGEYMCTDPEDGTNASDAYSGLADWLGDRGLFGVVVDRRARDNENVTYVSIRNMLQAGGNVVVSMGRYHFDDGEFERDSAHAMSLVSLTRTDAGTITIGVHDPNDDDHGSTQSATRVKTASLVEQTRNIEGDEVRVLRWGNSTDPYRFVDGWLAVMPVFLLTNAARGSLTQHRADMFGGELTSTRIALPFRGEIGDLALDTPNYAAAVIDRATGDVWRVALADGTWTKLPGSGARHIAFGGRQRRLFVARGRTVQALDESGRVTAQAEHDAPVEALSFDDRQQRLVAMFANGTRPGGFDAQLRPLALRDLPALDDEPVKVRAVKASPFAGVPMGTLSQVARSVSIVDPVRSREKRWRLGG